MFRLMTAVRDGRQLVKSSLTLPCALALVLNLSPWAQPQLLPQVLGVWTNTGSLQHDRIRHTATLLPNGLVLIVGGSSQSPVWGWGPCECGTV